MKASDIIRKLNQLGGENGIGLLDIVENRLVGMKDRGVYETPGGTILYRAHEVLEMITIDKDTKHMKQKLAVDFADLVYNGKWFTPLREALTAFAVDTQKHVTGQVKLKLYKGNIITASRHLPREPVLREPSHLRGERLQPGRCDWLHQSVGPARYRPGAGGAGKAEINFNWELGMRNKRIRLRRMKFKQIWLRRTSISNS